MYIYAYNIKRHNKYRQSHANNDTHCGLNGSSLGCRKEEKEGQESLEGPRKQRKTTNGYNERA